MFVSLTHITTDNACVGVGGREVLLAILPLMTDPSVSSPATSIHEYSVMLASFPGSFFEEEMSLGTPPSSPPRAEQVEES